MVKKVSHDVCHLFRAETVSKTRAFFCGRLSGKTEAGHLQSTRADTIWLHNVYHRHVDE